MGVRFIVIFQFSDVLMIFVVLDQWTFANLRGVTYVVHLLGHPSMTSFVSWVLAFTTIILQSSKEKEIM